MGLANRTNAFASDKHCHTNGIASKKQANGINIDNCEYKEADRIQLHAQAGITANDKHVLVHRQADRIAVTNEHRQADEIANDKQAALITAALDYCSKSFTRLVGFVGSIFIVLVLLAAMHDYHSKYTEIDNMIKKGSKPPLIAHHELVNRSDLVEDIVRSFIAARPKTGMEHWDCAAEIDHVERIHCIAKMEEVDLLVSRELFDIEPFGVIIGPTGTGKTQLIREACRHTPEGVLYLEISSTDMFVENLAKTVGMRIEATLSNAIIGKWIPGYIGYYDLPKNDYPKAVAIVIETLLERALLFKEEVGRPVCLFIDGADLLAKHNPETFRKLVDTAKSHANSGYMRIVFGCSEGNVVPIIQYTSSKSRIKEIEVGDLPDEKGIGYLKKCHMPHELATRIVKFAGGRMIFLRRSVMIYRNREFETAITMKDYDDIYEEIIEDLNVLFVYGGIEALVMGGDTAIDIIKHLENFDGGFYLYKYLDILTDKKKKDKVEKLVHSLIQANAFRYTAKLKVDWHSRLIRNVAIDFFKKSKKL